jgi:hypothetical protein
MSLVLVIMIGAGCGDDSTVPTPADADGFAPAFDCGGLADRWVAINQAYLDDLGAMTVGDLDLPTQVADAATRRFAMSLTEQARDATAAGCAAELVSGSSALCTRLDRLSASGPAGESIMERARSICQSNSAG